MRLGRHHRGASHWRQSKKGSRVGTCRTRTWTATSCGCSARATHACVDMLALLCVGAPHKVVVHPGNWKHGMQGVETVRAAADQVQAARPPAIGGITWAQRVHNPLVPRRPHGGDTDEGLAPPHFAVDTAAVLEMFGWFPPGRWYDPRKMPEAVWKSLEQLLPKGGLLPAIGGYPKGFRVALNMPHAYATATTCGCSTRHEVRSRVRKPLAPWQRAAFTGSEWGRGDTSGQGPTHGSACASNGARRGASGESAHAPRSAAAEHRSQQLATAAAQPAPHVDRSGCQLTVCHGRRHHMHAHDLRRSTDTWLICFVQSALLPIHAHT